jgi:hypothetical protein
MKALAIIALIFSALSLFIPVMGVFLAMLCSLMALITFRSQPTLAGVTFGIDLIGTAFLSPSIMFSDAVSSGAIDLETTSTAATAPGEVYWAYVGFHLFLITVAIVWRLLRGSVRQHKAEPTN